MTYLSNKPTFQAKIREDEKPSDPNAAIEAVIDAKNKPKSGQSELTASQLKNKKRKEAKVMHHLSAEVCNLKLIIHFENIIFYKSNPRHSNFRAKRGLFGNSEACNHSRSLK